MLLKYAVYTASLMLLSVSLLAACTSSQSTLLASTPTTLTRSTPTTAQARSTCQTSQLKLASDTGDAGMGHRAAQFSFQNTSNSTCTLFGYPDIQVLNGDHHAISIQVTQKESGYLFGPVALKVVSLEPTAKAYFVIDWIAAGVCSTNSISIFGTFLQAAPSGQTSALTVSAATIDACGGEVGVSPVSNRSILQR